MVRKIMMPFVVFLFCAFALITEVNAGILSQLNNLKNNVVNKLGQSSTGQALLNVASSAGGIIKNAAVEAVNGNVSSIQANVVPQLQQQVSQMRTQALSTYSQYVSAMGTQLQQLQNQTVNSVLSGIAQTNNVISTLSNNLDVVENNMLTVQQQIKNLEAQAGMNSTYTNGNTYNNLQAQNQIATLNQQMQQLSLQKQNLCAQMEQQCANQQNLLGSLQMQLRTLQGNTYDQTISIMTNLSSSVSDIISLRNGLDTLAQKSYATLQQLKSDVKSLNLQTVGQNIYTKLSNTPQAQVAQQIFASVNSLNNVDNLGAGIVNNLGNTFLGNVNTFSQDAVSFLNQGMNNVYSNIGTNSWTATNNGYNNSTNMMYNGNMGTSYNNTGTGYNNMGIGYNNSGTNYNTGMNYNTNNNVGNYSTPATTPQTTGRSRGTIGRGRG